eukprot:scaffold18005_cov84-Phaeocystis_antarctica.AAC.1
MWHSRIERARRKPTPQIASDCTEVQPAARDAVDASIDACGTQSHRAGTAKADAEGRATRSQDHWLLGRRS